MNLREHSALMASYNTWMNRRVYAAAARLPAETVSENRGAFFGSILGTLNHLLVADQVWLHRFAAHPARFAALDPIRTRQRPRDIGAIEHDTLTALQAARVELDEMIENWAAELTESDLDHVLTYASMKGIVSHRRFGLLLMHFFNHQTHHRGQTTTLLTQAGVDVGGTDLLELIAKLEID
ncbi:MAG: DinB family protein [Lysobacter sp.]